MPLDVFIQCQIATASTPYIVRTDDLASYVNGEPVGYVYVADELEDFCTCWRRRQDALSDNSHRHDYNHLLMGKWLDLPVR